jgi:UDP-N-acetylglucosamine:LPS N-acetylglucosamine transferase
MKTVLILSASLGDSHGAVARSLSDALETLSTDVRVEIFDLFENRYGTFNAMARKAYSKVIRFAPALWGGFARSVDRPALTDYAGVDLGRSRRDLGHLLQDTQPDVVVATHPLYASMIHDLYRDHSERPFRLLSLVTDVSAGNSAWIEKPGADLYLAADAPTAGAVRACGIGAEQIQTLGYPVSLLFGHRPAAALPEPAGNNHRRLLFVLDAPAKKSGKALKRLLEFPGYHLSVVVGRNGYLKPATAELLKKHSERVQVLGWTSQMPSLLMTHHLLIGPASVDLIYQSIAAHCPMIGYPIRSEHGSTEILQDLEIGTIAARPRQLIDSIQHAFSRDAKVWRRWRENLSRISRPDAALRIAESVLRECDHTIPWHRPQGFERHPQRASVFDSSTKGSAAHARPLLCDFHIHTSYSDGKLSVAEVIDFYGRRNFDCICLTDHLADPRRLIGKLGKLSRLTLNPGQLVEYFEVIERERRRAWRKYSMLVMAGLEFNKDGLSQKSSAHLLGIDLQAPILDCLDLPETIEQIHAQGGLAVASHPHIMKSEWGKNTLYLWEHQERFAPLLDAWEIANRNNVFNPVSAKRLPYLANSDFHKPKHIYSWKTLVSCDKTPEAIKECIRRNERIAITLYRENDSDFRLPHDIGESQPAEDARLRQSDSRSPLSPAA